MRTRAWLCLGCLVLSAATAAAQDDASKPTELFQALWFQQHLLRNPSYCLVVAEIISPKPDQELVGTKDIKLRIVKDFGGDASQPVPKEIALKAHLKINWPLTTDPAKKHHLATIRRYTRSGMKPTWVLQRIRYSQTVSVRGRVTLKYGYLIGIDPPTEGLTAAMGDLLAGSSRQDWAAKWFERMLEHVGGEDKPAREFASSFAAVNGWQFANKADQQDQPDAFARALLAVKDTATRRRMARAYSTARADLLPRDAELLKQIFGHEDRHVAARAFGDNLAHAAGRADALAELIRPALAGGGRPDNRRFVLAALTGWGKTALNFRTELERIARGELRPPVAAAERATALRILIDAKVEGADKLVLAALPEVPSAVGLEYAVKHKLYAAVPAVIGAVRDGKVQWTYAHAAALSLLTHRFPSGSFEDFDKWWRQIESAGQAQAMIDAGFASPQDAARAKQLIAQLGSDKYRQRQAAQKQLAGLAPAVLPIIKEAIRSSDRQIAVSAAALLAEAEKQFKGCKGRLDSAAKRERAGNSPPAAPPASPRARETEVRLKLLVKPQQR